MLLQQYGDTVVPPPTGRPGRPRKAYKQWPEDAVCATVAKTYEFSKDLLVHVAVTWWVMLCCNFHHTHRSLRSKLADGAFVHRMPAMVAGLAHAPLTIADILTAQLPGFTPTSRPTLAGFGMRRPNGPAP